MIRITLAVMLVAGCTRTWHYRSLRSVADEREMFVITDAAAFELVDVTLSGAAVTGTAERAWTIQRGQLVQPQQGESPDEVAHRARWSPVAADHGAITFRTSSIRYAAVGAEGDAEYGRGNRTWNVGDRSRHHCVPRRVRIRRRRDGRRHLI